jgi:hypothetical protein
LVWAGAAAQTLRVALKTQINGRIADAMGLSYQAVTTPSDDYRRAASLGLIARNPTIQHHTDAWAGQTGTVSWSLHESHLIKSKFNFWKLRTELKTVFLGIVLGFPYVRKFKAITVVQFERGLFNVFTAMPNFGGVALERVELEDARVEQAFQVYGNDQVEARYLLDPEFCARLMELNTAYEGKGLRLAFFEGRLIVVLDNRDAFETGSMKPDEDRKRIVDTIRMLERLIRMITALSERHRPESTTGQTV